MQDGQELRWYLSVIWRWAWLIIVCALLGTTAAFLVSSRMAPVYSASAKLLVQQGPATRPGEYNDIWASERLGNTYANLLNGPMVLEAAIAQLEMDTTATALASIVEAKLIPETQLLQVSVEHHDPELAARIANVVAEVLVTHVRTLQEEQYAGFLAGMRERMAELSALAEQTQSRIDALGTPVTSQQEADLAHLETILAGYRSTQAKLQLDYEETQLAVAQSMHRVTLVERARVPESPSTRRMLYTILAGAVGAALAAGVAFVIEYVDDSIKAPEDVRRTLDLDVLGTIGRLTNGEEELVVVTQPHSTVTEAFHVLCTNVRLSSHTKDLRSILVTSPGMKEGKSVIVANLAAAMAEAGLNVIALDADLRRPQLHRLFDLDLSEDVGDESAPWGLTGALLGGRMNGSLHPSQVEGLKVLPSGAPLSNPAQAVGSQRMQELIHALSQQADTVLIDSSPVLPVADAVTLARAVDGVLLVLRAGRTRREDARRAVQGLRHVGANVVGVVLSVMPKRKGSHYYSYRKFRVNGDRRRKHIECRDRGPAAVVRQMFGKR